MKRKSGIRNLQSFIAFHLTQWRKAEGPTGVDKRNEVGVTEEKISDLKQKEEYVRLQHDKIYKYKIDTFDKPF